MPTPTSARSSACSTLLLKVFTPTERSADRSHGLLGIAVTVFPLARSPDELFKWHWALSPANRFSHSSSRSRLALGRKRECATGKGINPAGQRPGMESALLYKELATMGAEAL